MEDSELSTVMFGFLIGVAFIMVFGYAVMSFNKIYMKKTGCLVPYSQGGR